MKSNFLWMLLCSLLLTGLHSSAEAQKVDFNTQIKPLLEKHCMECHNADGDSYPIELKDDAFSYIVEGEPEESDMYLVMVTDDEEELMPPADFNRPMSDKEKELFKTWIAEGADWPDDAKFVMWKPEASDDSDKVKADDEKTGDAAAAAATTDDAQDKDAKEVAPAVDPRIYKAAGSLHPAILHLPMGLLLAAGLFAFLSLRGNFVMSDCAYYCLWLGVLGSILACATGWYTGENTKDFTDIKEIFLGNEDTELYWHRLSALISTVFGLLVALYAMSARAKDPDEGATWKLGAIILACGIGYVGMTGGKLSHPSNHYKDLNSLWTEMIGDAAPAAIDSDDATTDADADSDESTDEEADNGEDEPQTGDPSIFGETSSTL